MAIAKRFRRDVKLARSVWGKLRSPLLLILVELLRRHRLSIASGDLLLIDGHWYVSHTGLLGLARRNKCAGINVQPVPSFCDPAAQRWAFAATVFKSQNCRGFRRLRRCRSLQRFSAGPRRRDAHRGDPSRQSCPAQGVWHRHLLGRGDRDIPVQIRLRSRSFLPKRPTETGTVLARRSATGFARSSASTSSIPSW